MYSSKTDEGTLEAIKLNIDGISKISKERIFVELIKIFKLKNFLKINDYSDLKSIFLLIFPEIRYIDRLKKISGQEDILRSDIVNQLGILIIDETNNQEYFCHKYKTSKNISDKLNLLAAQYKELKKDRNFFDKNLKKNIYFLGRGVLKMINLIDYSEKKGANNISSNNHLKKYLDTKLKIEKIEVPRFLVDGNYLKKIGMKEGKAIGRALKLIEREWVDNDFNISEERILKIAGNKNN